MSMATTILGSSLAAAIVCVAALYVRLDYVSDQHAADKARISQLVREQVAIEQARVARREIGQITGDLVHEAESDSSSNRLDPIDAAILDKLRSAGFYRDPEPTDKPRADAAAPGQDVQ